MKTKYFKIEQHSVGYIEVREDELEDGDPNDPKAWEEAAFELITPDSFEVFDDEIDLIEEGEV